MIYNYVLCWFYSITKIVVIALIYFLAFCGTVLCLVLSWWSIKYAMKINAISLLARKKFTSKGSWEKVVEGHLWKPNRRKSPMMRVTKNWEDKKQKNPLGPSGRNNGSLTQQIYTWVLKRQSGSKKSGKKEIASHGQSMS